MVVDMKFLVARADGVVLVAGARCGVCPSEKELTAVVWPAVAMLLRCSLAAARRRDFSPVAL